MKHLVLVSTLLALLAIPASGADQGVGGGVPRGPLPLNQPLTSFNCSPQEVQPDVVSNLQTLSDAVRSSNNPACNSLKLALPDGASVQSLMTRYGLNPDQMLVSQDQASLDEIETLQGYMSNPSTAPPGFNASDYSMAELQKEQTDYTTAIASAQAGQSALQKQMNLTTGLLGAQNVNSFADDLMTAMQEGCLKGKGAQIANNVVGLAGFFLAGPVGMGVELGTKLLNGILELKAARHQSKQQQSVQMQLTETEIGLKCSLEQAGKTQCDLIHREPPTGAVCTTPAVPAMPQSTVGDLANLQKFLGTMDVDDKGVVNETSRNGTFQDFFADSPNAPFQIIQRIDTELNDMKQALKISIANGIASQTVLGSMDMGLLNSTIQEFDTLKGNAVTMQSELLDATSDQQKQFLATIRKTLYGGEANGLVNVAVLNDKFAQFYAQNMQKLNGTGEPSDATLAFVKANGQGSMADILNLLQPTRGVTQEANDDSTKLNYEIMQQLQISFADQINSLVKQYGNLSSSDEDADIKSVDARRLNYFCMSMLDLPDLGKGGGKAAGGLDANGLKSTCANAKITVGGQTLTFDEFENLPFSRRVCALPYFSLKSAVLGAKSGSKK